MTRRTIKFALLLTGAFAAMGSAGASAESLDARFAHLSSTAPGFGGMFVEDGVLNVYMTKPGATASKVLRGVDHSGLPARTRVLKGRYTFARLNSWHARLNPSVLGLPGVVMTDIDDRQNRLAVGVSSKRARSRVEARLRELGIPRRAVRIRTAAPLDQFSSLNDYHRPLVGGLQNTYGQALAPGLPCTLGFIAVRQGVPGQIVNSHCTNVQGSIEGTVYHQPFGPDPANRIGVEAVDPVYFRGGNCFPNRRCRFSDTAFVKRDSGVPASVGYIAKADPSPSTAWNGDLYRITAKADAIVGTFVEKVGRTTGRSGAPVDRTCSDFSVNNTNIVLFCQNTAQLFPQPGDSGSPVFTPNGSDATVRGELWGGNPSTGQGIFSPITGMQRPTEMGPISICAPGFGC